ncbi:hypothetical protein QNH46_23535 [Paenibacillus woosongensis]|uniref:Uncharacterized protein n=1 Tax=Paenibacillus woosongensis TaxID=307580 RepID=A0AA95KTL3_9BACL|nr:hypothetical protein [Paenibacillus woosongensis]WHX48983.1 hypothetical protein QNH46_23535 [Paenibacillus woosongensis]
MFQDEKALVLQFVDQLKTTDSPWGEVKYGTEFDYQRGRTDIIVVSPEGKVIAIEAKLTKWKTALQQAYRNQCFADLSYVLLPETEINNASRYSLEFRKRGVGLCYLADGGINIAQDAYETEPLQPWLREKAMGFVEN